MNEDADFQDYEQQRQEYEEFIHSKNLDENVKTNKSKDKMEQKPEEKAEEKKEMRKSIFDTHHPVDDINWREIIGMGWLHRTEELAFARAACCCSVTGRYVWSRDIVFTETGAMICTDEANANWQTCEFSGRYFKRGSGLKAKDAEGKAITISPTVAGDSFFKCDFSGELHPSNMAVHVKKSIFKRVALSLVRKGVHFKQCMTCDSVFEAAHIKTYVDIGQTCCVTCYNKVAFKDLIFKHNHVVALEPLHSVMERYGHKVVDGLVWATEKKEPFKSYRLFGVEVETEFDLNGMKKASLTRHAMAKNVLRGLGKDFVLCKEDGTLLMNGHYANNPADGRPQNDNGPTYAGFEIVSAPADLEIHRQKWPLLGKIDGFKHMRAWDTDTCGMHVHVTREALTYLQIARILIFINHKNNKLFIQKIAGRNAEKFCRYQEKEVGDALKVDPRNDENRRQAVNLCNAKTIEFRIFRGTVHPNHILRNIEFCDSVCDFCYPGSRSMNEFKDHKSFIAFVDNNRKKWPLLAGWFAMHKFIELDLKDVVIKRKMVHSKTLESGKKIFKMEEEKIPLDRSKFTIRPEAIVEPEIKLNQKEEQKKDDIGIIAPPPPMRFVAAAQQIAGAAIGMGEIAPRKKKRPADAPPWAERLVGEPAPDEAAQDPAF